MSAAPLKAPCGCPMFVRWQGEPPKVEHIMGCHEARRRVVEVFEGPRPAPGEAPSGKLLATFPVDWPEP